MDLMSILSTSGGVMIGILGSTGLNTWLNNRATRKLTEANAKEIADNSNTPLVNLLVKRIEAVEAELVERRRSEAAALENYYNLKVDFETFKAKHVDCVKKEGG